MSRLLTFEILFFKGDKRTLEKLHREFVIRFNAQVDRGVPRSEADIRSQVLYMYMFMYTKQISENTRTYVRACGCTHTHMRAHIRIPRGRRNGSRAHGRALNPKPQTLNPKH